VNDDLLLQAFEQYRDTAAQPKFTRRIAINIADVCGETPKYVTLRLERLGKIKTGAWDWFVRNGGITLKQIIEVRTERETESRSVKVASA
jgi:hypothetical protein